MNVLVDRHRRDQREDPRHRTDRAPEVPLGANDDARTDGGRQSSSWPRTGSTTWSPSATPDGSSPTVRSRNLAISLRGWVGFDFAAAFGRPVKVINDAAMQALGSYKGGTMLFLGFGTGLGSALIVRGHIVPMELGALSYGKGIHRGLRGPSRAREARQEEVAEDRRAAS